MACAFLFCAYLSACGTKDTADAERKESGQEGTLEGADVAGAEGEREEVTWQGATEKDGLVSLTERTEYYDLTVRQEELFGSLPEPGNLTYAIGTQFYKGEPVQLWVSKTSQGSDIYLYRKDGSGELLLESAPGRFTASGCQWYLDREGDFYCRSRSYLHKGAEYIAQCSYVKILSSGEIASEDMMEDNVVIEDFCQTEDGRMYLLSRNLEDDTRFLEEIDPSTGLRILESRKEVPLQFMVYLGNGGDSPAVTGYSYEDISRRVMKMDPANGSMSLVLSFSGTTYGMHDDLELQDCRVLEDGSLEFVWTQRSGNGGLLERLKMEKVDKIPIVLRGVFWHDTWLANKITRFNGENSDYHVIMEDCWDGRQQEEFFRMTSVQIGAGKGPDILCGNQLPQGYIGGMLEKGTLEDLASYMEASDIREEDYFSLAFATWRQGERIYGVNPRMGLWGEELDERVLGSRDVPDIESLADALLALESDGVYYEGWDSAQVLKSFLQGTDSLWGMVDWEGGTCDFSKPLLGKLLEAARRHGDDGRKKPESTIMRKRQLGGVVYFHGQAQQEEEGWVTSGVLFDDGCYVSGSPAYTLAINASSPHKEGAWEFIRFLLDEESQSTNLEWGVPPVNRKAFEIWMQKNIQEMAQMRNENGIVYYPAYYGTDVSEEKQAEYRRTLEEAKPLPLRTEPILDIILEEAEDYFNGYKNAEEISRVVDNRVQLYLDERR